MKKFKRLTALALALVMVLGLTTGAGAAGATEAVGEDGRGDVAVVGLHALQRMVHTAGNVPRGVLLRGAHIQQHGIRDAPAEPHALVDGLKGFHHFSSSSSASRG